MKKALIFIGLLLIVCASLAQTVNIRGSKMILQYGANNYSVELKGDSVLIDASDFIWFADKIGSDTLLFGDGTYMTTAFVSGVNDTGYVKTTGDSLYGTLYWPGSGNSYIRGNTLYFVNSTDFLQAAPSQLKISAGTQDYSNLTSYGLRMNKAILQSIQVDTNGVLIYGTDYAVRDEQGNRYLKHTYADSSTTIYNKLILESPNSKDEIITINNIKTGCDSTVKADDESIVLTNGISGWGEVYAFKSGTIEEWAEFIISSDGTVYLKSNSTNVVTTDTDGKLCIFDNGSGVTIRNRLGGSRTIKYIIHH